jgi:polyisoprenoid-binding protein YceI
MKTITASILALLMISLPVLYAINSWKVKSGEATIRFTSGKINGSFKGLKADIVFDKEHPGNAKISATIDAGSIATGFFLKNSHAMDALDSDKYPTIKFVSVSVSGSAGAYLAKGNLTLKGITKPATIRFSFEEEVKGGVFKGSLGVSPKDFGINRSGTPAVVNVQLVVPVVKS